MSENVDPSDDISALWGPEYQGLLQPEPRRNPERRVPPPTEANAQNGHGNGQIDRLSAIERDVRGLVELIERVDARLNLRLDMLEQRVAQVTAQRDAGQPDTEGRRVQKGMARISEVIKSTRNQ